jgi:hypothetical protein
MAPWSTQNDGELCKIDVYDEKCCIAKGRNGGNHGKWGTKPGKDGSGPRKPGVSASWI